MIYALVALSLTQALTLVGCYLLVRYLLGRQDRYVAAGFAQHNPVAAAIINTPDPGPRNAHDEARAAGANPPVPFMG
jgi:hypothetical protein